MTFINHLEGYFLIFTTGAQKDLKNLPRKSSQTIYKKLSLLIAGKDGLDIKRLTDYPSPTYRLRVGVCRAIYEVYEHKVVELVIGVKHRKEAYKAEAK